MHDCTVYYFLLNSNTLVPVDKTLDQLGGTKSHNSGLDGGKKQKDWQVLPTN